MLSSSQVSLSSASLQRVLVACASAFCRRVRSVQITSLATNCCKDADITQSIAEICSIAPW
jgi:hypothetical protein